MNRETTFVREITQLSEQGKLKWSNVPPGKYMEYIFQSPLAYQVFAADYSKSGSDYQLLIVHKKFPSHNMDFEIIEEKHRTELLVLHGGKLISTITPYAVEAGDLGELAAVVEQKNDEADKLFA